MSPFIRLATVHLVVRVVLERVPALRVLVRVAFPALDSRYWGADRDGANSVQLELHFPRGLHF